MRVALARLRSHGRVRAEGHVRIGRGVRFHLAPGAVITLEDRCDIGAGTRFHVHGEARIGAGRGSANGVSSPRTSASTSAPARRSTTRSC